MSALPIPKVSVEEYLVAERATDLRSEYHDGTIFPVGAATWKHGQLLASAGSCLTRQLDGRHCRLSTASVHVRVSPANFVCPDIVVVCGKPDFTDDFHDTITNPKVIVEVLSPATAAREYRYEEGAKFAHHRRVPSFEEYVLISQDKPQIETFRKSPDGGWILTSYQGLEAVARVESLDIAIPLAEIYADVEM